MELYPLFYLGVVPTVLSWSCIHCFILELYPLFYFGVVFTVCHGVVSWSFILFTVFFINIFGSIYGYMYTD